MIAVREDVLDGPPWDGTCSWIHSDPAPPDLLVREGRLRAVLDFGATGPGDPATDLNPALSTLGRRMLREVLADARRNG